MKNISLIIVLALIIVGGFIYLRPDNNTTSETSGTNIADINNYQDYSVDSLKSAQAEGRVVLFFHANWCPTCRALDKELKSGNTNLPDDVTILKVNYDKERELKKKYQVTVQHTLVQIDENGDEITKWIGGNSDLILQRLN